MKKRKDFSADQKEWNQTLVNVFTTILKIQVKPVVVYDRKHFLKLTTKDRYRGDQVWAECVKETGMIWLSKNLINCTKVDLINVIIHELLHIKYAKWSESKVRAYANKLTSHKL